MYFCIMNDNFVNAKAAQKYIKIEVYMKIALVN